MTAPSSVARRVAEVQRRVNVAAARAGRDPADVQVIAVSKRQPVPKLEETRQAGLHVFGESYVSEALPKIATMGSQGIGWHFIGPVQSNKTRPIAESFDWVHSMASERIARRLSDQRPVEKGPLNVCLQVNIDADPAKSGVLAEEAAAASTTIAALPGLRLRGLMTIPMHRAEGELSQLPFERLAELFARLRQAHEHFDTLSMGMSGDFELAIASGATVVRIGTAIYGPREAGAEGPA